MMSFDLRPVSLVLQYVPGETAVELPRIEPRLLRANFEPSGNIRLHR